MKGNLARTILEAIGETAMNAGDLLEVFLSSPYGTSFSGFQYRFNKKQSRRVQEEFENRELQRLRRRYYNLVSWLKREGMIQERRDKKEKVFSLTRRGLERLKILKTRALLPATNAYEKEAGERLVIALFDIPERERRKRDWIREVLRNLGFTMLQRSAWVGKVKIPKQFINDLADFRLVECVEIFEITKAGSLHHLI